MPELFLDGFAEARAAEAVVDVLIVSAFVSRGEGEVMVAPAQRHSRARRCPICGGCDQDPRGAERRCHGYVSSDEEYIHCARPEYAGPLEMHDVSGLYAHKFYGSCRCGVEHNPARANGARTDNIEATYDYRDEHGALLFQVVRKIPKGFWCRSPSSDGLGWDKGLNGARRVLYRLPQVLAAPATETVWIVEGEKDADRLAQEGLVATCNPHGARKWHLVEEHASEVLRSRTVVVIADADEEGRKHAKQVERSLTGSTKSVTVIELEQKDASAFFEMGGTVEQLLARVTGPVSVPWTRPEERARRWVGRTVVRLATGFVTFDAACRGGIPSARRVFLLGPPGVGKTTLVIQWGIQWAREGIVVAILAADEEADGLLIRVGQVLGFSRELLEDGNEDECLALSRLLRSNYPNLHLVDADEDDATIDSVSARLADLAGTSEAVLITDSIQTADAIGTDRADGPRARVDCVISSLKLAQKKRGQTVLATSEVSRGAYRVKGGEINLLAAGKESGGIEYHAHAQLVLLEAENAIGEVDVHVPKLRFGRRPKDPFRLRQDFKRATFEEIAGPEKASEESINEALVARAKRRCIEIVLKRRTPITSRAELATCIGGKRTVAEKAISELLGDEVLRKKPRADGGGFCVVNTHSEGECV